MADSAKKVMQLLRSAKECISKKEFDEALNHLKNALRMDKNNYNVFLLIGWCYACMLATKVDSGTSSAATVSSSDDKSFFQRSEQAYTKATEISPENPLSWQGLYDLFTKHNENDEKIAHVLATLIKTITDANPASDKLNDLMKRLASLHEKYNRLDECLDIYEKLLARTPSDSFEELQAVYVHIATVIELQQSERVRIETASRLNRHLKALQQQQPQQQQQPKSKQQQVTPPSSPTDPQQQQLEKELQEQIRNELSLQDPRLDEVYKKIVELSDRGVVPPVGTYTNLICRLNRRLAVSAESDTSELRCRIVTECKRLLHFHPNALFPLKLLLLLNEEDDQDVGDESSVQLWRYRLVHGFPQEGFSLIQLASLMQQHSSKLNALNLGEQRLPFQWESVEMLLERGCQDCPHSIFGWLLYGQVCHRLSKFHKAIECVERGILEAQQRCISDKAKLERLSLQLKLQLAQSNHRAHQREKAEKIYGELFAQCTSIQMDDPNFRLHVQLECLRGLGQISLERSTPDKSVEFFTKAIMLSCDQDHVSHSRLGHIYFSQCAKLMEDRSTLLEKARCHLERAVELHDSNAVYHEQLALIYWELQGTFRSEKHFSYDHFLLSARFATQNPEAAVVPSGSVPTLLTAEQLLAICFSHLGQWHHFFQRDNERAKKCLRRAVELDPLDIYHDAGERLSQLYLRDQQITLAEEMWISVTSRNTRAKWAWKRLALHQKNSDKLEDALLSFQHALRLDPKDFVCWEGLAETYQKQGKLLASLRAYDRAFELNPKSTFSLFQMASIKRLLGQFREARKMFEQLIELQQSISDTVSNLGGYYGLAEVLFETVRQLFKDGLYEACAQHLFRAEATLMEGLRVTHSNLVAPWKLLGDIQFFFHNLSEETISRHTNLAHPDIKRKLSDEDRHSRRATKMEALERASRSYAHAIHLNPSHAYSWYDLGVSCYYRASCFNKDDSEGRGLCRAAIQEAKHLFRCAIKLCPSEAQFWNALGCVESEIVALRHHAFIRAIQKDPKSHLPWDNLGFSYLLLGEHVLSKACFAQSQNLDPSSNLSWMGMAMINERVPQLEAIHNAKTAFEHVVSLDPKPTAMLGLAYTAFVTNKPLQASHAFQQYLQFDHSDFSAWNMLGLCLESLGRFEWSERALETAVSLIERTIQTHRAVMLPVEKKLSTMHISGQVGTTETLVFHNENEKPYELDVILGLASSNLARVQCARGDYRKAYATYLRCFKGIQMDISALRGFALACFMFGDKQEECVQLLTNAYNIACSNYNFKNATGRDKIDKEKEELLISLSQVHFHMNNPTASTQYSEECLRLYPQSTGALCSYVAMLLMSNRTEQAIPLLRRARAISGGTDLNMLRFEFLFFLAVGDMKAARSVISKTIHLYPHMQELWDDLANMTLAQSIGGHNVSCGFLPPRQPRLPRLHNRSSVLTNVSGAHLCSLANQLMPPNFSKFILHELQSQHDEETSAAKHVRTTFGQRLLNVASLYYNSGLNLGSSATTIATLKTMLRAIQRLMMTDPTTIPNVWPQLACTAHALSQLSGLDEDYRLSIRLLQSALELETGKVASAPNIFLHIGLCEDMIAVHQFAECLQHIKDTLADLSQREQEGKPIHPSLAHSQALLFAVLAKCLHQRGEPDHKYMKMFEKALSSNPECLYTWKTLCGIYIQQEQLQRARICLETCLSILEKNASAGEISGRKSESRSLALVSAYTQLAHVLLRLRDFKQANSVLQKLVRISTDSPVGLSLAGQVQFSLKFKSSKNAELQQAEAFEWLQRASMLNRSMPLVNFALFKAASALQMWDRAEAALWFERDANPTSPFVYNALATFAFESNAPIAALGLAQKAVHSDPTNPIYWATLSSVLPAAELQRQQLQEQAQAELEQQQQQAASINQTPQS